MVACASRALRSALTFADLSLQVGVQAVSCRFHLPKAPEPLQWGRWQSQFPKIPLHELSPYPNRVRLTIEDTLDEGRERIRRSPIGAEGGAPAPMSNARGLGCRRSLSELLPRPRWPAAGQAPGAPHLPASMHDDRLIIHRDLPLPSESGCLRRARQPARGVGGSSRSSAQLPTVAGPTAAAKALLGPSGSASWSRQTRHRQDTDKTKRESGLSRSPSFRRNHPLGLSG